MEFLEDFESEDLPLRFLSPDLLLDLLTLSSLLMDLEPLLLADFDSFFLSPLSAFESLESERFLFSERALDLELEDLLLLVVFFGLESEEEDLLELE